MTMMRSAVVGALALVLSACGGAKLGGGKEGAAQALHQVSAAGNAGKGSMLKLLESGVDANVSATAKGKHGGSAAVTGTMSTPPIGQTGDITLTMTITYNGFNEDGKNAYDGTMTMTWKMGSLTNTTADITSTMKGKVNISGAVSDYVDANITEKISLQELSATSGSITFSLDGSIATASESYTFANEQLVLTAGAELPTK